MHGVEFDAASARSAASLGGALAAAIAISLGLAVPSIASAQNSALIPAPFQEERHEAFLEIARQGGIDCLLMGDSITDWWDREGMGLPVYEERFGDLSCANFGIAGDRTQGVLWRMENGELDGYSPRAVMLMIGTNNLSGFRSEPNSPEQIAMATAVIVTKLRETFPDAGILLLGVFPRGAEPDGQYREPIRRINELIAHLDDGEHVHYMDIGDRFLEPDGSISEEVMADGLHPSTLGYEIWADAVMPTFREMMSAP